MSSILVIEDEKGILGLIEAALSRHGHRVDTAADGKEGIQKFDDGNFDMVITDVVMPEVGGLGVLQHIRGGIRSAGPHHRYVRHSLAHAWVRLRHGPRQAVPPPEIGGFRKKPRGRFQDFRSRGQ